jgi:hypothetical protein
MQSVRWRSLVIIAIGMAGVLLSPMFAEASGTLAAISGIVHDSTGEPVVGALVVVIAANPSMSQRMAFTDKRGGFSIPNLFAGEYSVKVTMPRFLPAFKNGIQINSGGTATLTVNLQNALDIVHRMVSGEKSQNDDIVWTLRSSRSSQPILRLASTNSNDVARKQDYSGYFQLYSKSVETSGETAEAVIGSQFSVTMPLASQSKVTVAGQYSAIPTQPRGFGAKYQFRPADRHRASFALNVRQGALVGDPLNGDATKEVQLEYGEDFQWSDHFVVNYGAELGRADAMSDRNYFRPRVGLSWVPQARTTFTVGASSQAPSSPDDPIRGKEYFERAAYIPPALERYRHTEAAMSRVVTDTTDVSAAVFSDATDTQVLFVTSADGRREIVILDSSKNSAQGLRLHIDRTFGKIQGGLGYTTATGLGLGEHAPDNPSEIQSQLVPMRFHLVTARLKASVDATQTQLTAVYRWAPNFSATRLDPYDRTTEYNDPSLSLTVAQDLPTWGMVPGKGKVQAILDARNLFERPYGMGTMQVAQYPRLFKGGINFKF